MSAYSLEILDSEKYSRDFQENILYSFDSYIYKEHFRVGEGIKDDKELKHSLIFSRILCTDNCEISNYIQDKIEGKLESCNKKKKKKLISSIFNFCQQESCSADEFSSVAWTKSLW
jgi:hypothetical protein